jgi:HlyD family secretion protein
MSQAASARRLLLWLLVCVAGALVIFYGFRSYRTLTKPNEPVIPTAKVQRGDVSLSITARASLTGGNSETLTAPMTGSGDLHIVSIRKSGDQVKSGETIVQLDTSEQTFKLKEAQGDLAESEQHMLQATADREAVKEEDQYALLKAQADVRVAELDTRKNPLLPAIVAKQNDLALQSARDHLAQLEKNVANRQATSDAGIAIQAAGKTKAEAQIKTAQQNIDAMTLRSHRAGYVSIKTISSNFGYEGMVLPPYQLGDAVHPGMAIVEIPDLNNWELNAKLEEADRGHITLGDKAAITVIAVPSRRFVGRVKDLGTTAGPFWDRHFECKISLDNPTPELRPGMSGVVVLTTDVLHNVLWLPAQALFEADGRTFVYARAGKSFAPKDVKLIRRNETRAIVSGLTEGQDVALSNPTEAAKKAPAAGSALKSVGK